MVILVGSGRETEESEGSGALTWLLWKVLHLGYMIFDTKKEKGSQGTGPNLFSLSVSS